MIGLIRDGLDLDIPMLAWPLYAVATWKAGR
jgi:hypothetical protein